VSRLLAVLFEVAALDLVTFVSIPVMLSAIVRAACMVPARRAACLSPVDTLRTKWAARHPDRSRTRCLR
jgi:hypothetical protein